jgi:hypothetical protein
MEKNQKYFTLAVLVLSFFIFLRSCGISSEVNKVSKELKTLNEKINKIDSAMIKSNDMVKIIKETPNWKTLEIEELSDKNKIPINFYKNMGK